MPRLNESTQLPRMAPSGGCNGGAIALGSVFAPISTVVWLNVTVAGTVSFHMLDGTTVTQAFPVGFFVLEIQCDTITLGGATATASAFYNPL